VDMGIPTGFYVGMGWVWTLKFNPHGSPACLSNIHKFFSVLKIWKIPQILMNFKTKRHELSNYVQHIE